MNKTIKNRLALKNELRRANKENNERTEFILSIIYDYGEYGGNYVRVILELDEEGYLYYEFEDVEFYIDYTKELPQIKHHSEIKPYEALLTFFKAKNEAPISLGTKINYELPVLSWFKTPNGEIKEVQGNIQYYLED